MPVARIVLRPVSERCLHTGLESPVHPQAGKPALRSADILVGGLGQLALRPAKLPPVAVLRNFPHLATGTLLMCVP